METWVLWFWIGVGIAGGNSTLAFSNKDACQDVGEDLMGRAARDTGSFAYRYVCINTTTGETVP